MTKVFSKIYRRFSLYLRLNAHWRGPATLHLNFWITLAYFALAKMGLTLATINHSASPVWPATGFAISIIVLFGPRALPGIAIGALGANLTTPIPALASIGIMLGNTLEAGVGASVIWWLRRKSRKGYEIETEMVALLCGIIVGSILSASVGVLSLLITGEIHFEASLATWVTWSIGDGLGGLILTPAILHFSSLSGLRSRTYHVLDLLKSVLILSLLFFCFALVFLIPSGTSYLFIFFPLVLLAAILFSRSGLWLITPIICTGCIWMTILDRGPFTGGTLNENLIHLQLFLISMGATALSLSMILNMKILKIPSVVFMTCWLITGTLFFSFDRHEKSKDAHRFNEMTDDLNFGLLSQIESYEENLYAGVGFYMGSKDVDHSEWLSFLQAQRVLERHAGLSGVGVVWPVPHSQLPAFESDMKKRGFKDFAIKSLDGGLYRDVHYIIKYIEPLDQNRPAQGLDLSSEARRLEAANKARDTGKPAITSMIKLVQDNEKRSGFLLYLPMYKKGQPTATVEQRRKALLGWVYAPFVYEKMLQSVFKKAVHQIDLFVYDGSEIEPKNLIYQSNGSIPSPETFDKVTYISVGQKMFAIGWTRAPGFVTSHDTTIAWVGLCGSLLSIFLVSLVVALQMIGEKSKQIAEALNHDKTELNHSLQDALEKQKLITDNVPALIAYWDKEEKCQFANRPVLDWFGTTQDKVLGTSMLELLGKETYEENRNQIRGALSGTAQYFEKEIRRGQKGDFRYIQSYYIPHKVDQEVKGFFYLVTDVTAQKQAELNARADQEKAIAASKVKSEFLANMSHEIRTPINGVIGMAGLLTDTQLSDKQQEYAATIKQSAENLLTIINDILDFSKVEAGKLDLEEIEFDLNTMIEDTLKSLNFSAGQKGLSLIFEDHAHLHNAVWGDPGRIRQILTNLLGNAIKFTQKGWVRLDLKTLPSSPSHHRLCFIVSDTGVGMSQEEQTKLFQAFTQADASTSRRFGGTGLGLSISKRLVQLMKGNIDVTSEEGKGSTFWFEIELKKSAMSLAETQLDQELNRQKQSKQLVGRILVAEDNIVNQKIAISQLQKYGLRAEAAANGKEVLNALRKIPYDLILMDCQMPEMDGYAATHSIRQSHDTSFARIPIIAMTANALKGDREKCIEAGMDDYVSKPTQERALIETIIKWLGRKSNSKVYVKVPSIDRQVIQNLRSVQAPGQPNPVSSMIDLFFESSWTSLEQIRQAMQSSDLKVLAESAHSLGSVSANLGAHRFADLCRKLEQDCQQKMTENLPSLIQQLESEYRLVFSELIDIKTEKTAS